MIKDISDTQYLTNNKPKISVVIPIFNAAKFLNEAIESALNQTLKEIEIICVNDGSTDNSLSIIENYALKDKRIKIINKDNSGYGATVNLGLSSAVAEYVAIFEPDDILDETMYDKLYKLAIDNNLDVVKCNFYNYWSKIGKSRRSGLIKRCAKNIPFKPVDNLKALTCHASVWAGIYKKSFLDTNNIKFLETPGASYQDMSFSFKVYAMAEKVMLIKDPLIYYRQDNPNSSINNPSKVFCVCNEYNEITNFLNNHQDIKKRFNTQKLVNQYRAYIWNLSRLDESLREPFLKRFSDEFKQYYDNNEINNDFYKSIKKSNLKLLINNPQLFYRKSINKDFLWWTQYLADLF